MTLGRLIGMLGLIAAVAWGPNAVRGEEPATAWNASPSTVLQQVRFRQRLNHVVPRETRFLNERGRPTTLGECLGDRPAILVLAYYRCPMLCNQVLEGLTRSLRALAFRPGQDFDVVVISFDPTDTPEMAAAKKETVLQAVRSEPDAPGWHFLVGEERSSRAVADSIGFEYQYDKRSNQFAHASGIVVLTPTGRISRYFYGIEYPTRDLRLGLVEASAGQIGSPVDELLLFCFHYDPLTGRYGLAVMRVIRAGGIATVFGIVCFIAVALRRERRGGAAAPSYEPGSHPA